MGADFIRSNLEITQISPKMTSRENGNIYANSIHNEENCQLPNQQQPPSQRSQFYYDSTDSHSPYYPNGLATAVTPGVSATNGNHDPPSNDNIYGINPGLSTAGDTVSLVNFYIHFFSHFYYFLFFCFPLSLIA